MNGRKYMTIIVDDKEEHVLNVPIGMTEEMAKDKLIEMYPWIYHDKLTVICGNYSKENMEQAVTKTVKRSGRKN